MYIQNNSFYVYYLINGKCIRIKENLTESQAMLLSKNLDAYYTC